jgi:hypothetical protein
LALTPPGGGAGASTLASKLRTLPLFKNNAALGKAVGALEWVIRWLDCLAPGTLVQTAGGPVPIESIAVGDLVLAWDPASGGQAYQPVTEVPSR